MSHLEVSSPVLGAEVEPSPLSAFATLIATGPCSSVLLFGGWRSEVSYIVAFTHLWACCAKSES